MSRVELSVSNSRISESAIYRSIGTRSAYGARNLAGNGRIKAGKNFKVTEPKFSNVTALNRLAKFYCIIVSADRTLQTYATICIFQIRNLSYTDVTHITHVTFVRNTKSLEIGNMPLKSSELRQAS